MVVLLRLYRHCIDSFSDVFGGNLCLRIRIEPFLGTVDYHLINFSSSPFELFFVLIDQLLDLAFCFPQVSWSLVVLIDLMFQPFIIFLNAAVVFPVFQQFG